MSESKPVERQLHRELSVWGAMAFVVTNMIGTGIFTVPAFVRAATGNGLTALLVWALGGGLALCGAFCYAELSTRMPEAGGEYQYLSRVFGPMWGFISGWISFLAGFSAAIAAAALGATAYAASLFGWQIDHQLIAPLGITVGSAMAAGLILLLALFHCLGLRPGGRLQTIIAGSVVIGILVLIGAGFLTGSGDWHGVTAGLRRGGMWWVALIQVSFAYSGWNAAAYLAGEVRDPRRTLPRALIGGTLIVAILYLGLNLLFLYAVPAESWEPTIAIGKVAAERLFGAKGSLAISAIITVTILGSVSAMTAAGPRVYYAMSRDGLAPAIFGRLGTANSVPTVSILIQALVSILLVLTGEFETLLIYIGSALSLIAALTVTAVWFVRRDGAKEGVFLTPGYPITPAIFLGLELTAFLLGLRERPIPTGAALATILAGGLIYLVTEHRKSAH
jgi:APA family basic amino acid/polyamine antiporter